MVEFIVGLHLRVLHGIPIKTKKKLELDGPRPGTGSKLRALF